MRFFVWLFRAFLFFALFAFALNNQHDASVKWFFGQEWRAPMVFIVLAAFGLGLKAACEDEALAATALDLRYLAAKTLARTALAAESDLLAAEERSTTDGER